MHLAACDDGNDPLVWNGPFLLFVFQTATRLLSFVLSFIRLFY